MKNVNSNQELDSSDPLKSDNNKSILDVYRYVNGRRYHNLADVTYFFPNDDKEVARLNLQHNLFKYFWQSSFSSPVHELLKSGKAKVLDVGCGTGQWLLDMAHDYPEATFVGLDMSPNFPDVKDTPPNVCFLQLNLNDGIPFPNETFDFVFQRFLCNSVEFKQWKYYVKEMVRVAKTGGWLEFFEFDIESQNASPFFASIDKLMCSGFETKGINSRPETCVPQFLESCQELSKIHFKEVHTPLKDQPEKLGDMVSKYVSMNADTIKLLMTSVWGIKEETYDSIINNTKHEFDESKVFIKSFRWYSKKI